MDYPLTLALSPSGGEGESASRGSRFLIRGGFPLGLPMSSGWGARARRLRPGGGVRASGVS